MKATSFLFPGLFFYIYHRHIITIIICLWYLYKEPQPKSKIAPYHSPKMEKWCWKEKHWEKYGMIGQIRIFYMLELSTPFWVWDNSLYPTDNTVRWSYTCKVIKNQYCDTTVSSNSHFCFSEKYKVAVEDLPSALEDVHPSPFCEPCERNGKLKMTAGTYCVTCEHKFCAAHQKVPKYLWN